MGAGAALGRKMAPLDPGRGQAGFSHLAREAMEVVGRGSWPEGDPEPG